MKITPVIIAIALMLTGSASSDAQAAETTATYGLHLFINETEFVDVMTLAASDTGTLSGHMSVPNDFDGPLLAVAENGLNLRFELLVPKNAARPVDLMFVYEGRFFDVSKEQFIGFVTIKDQPGFVASFVAFKRPG